MNNKDVIEVRAKKAADKKDASKKVSFKDDESNPFKPEGSPSKGNLVKRMGEVLKNKFAKTQSSSLVLPPIQPPLDADRKDLTLP